MGVGVPTCYFMWCMIKTGGLVYGILKIDRFRMARSKWLWLGGLIGLEILIFGMFYFFSKHGLRELQRLSQENQELQVELEQLRADVSKLEQQLQIWQEDDFYKEKIARERLHLSKPGEQIYHLV